MRRGEERRENEINICWTFLTSVRTEIEADILIGLLELDNIPIKKNYPGMGNLRASYGLINGVEIYVPKDLIFQAKEILSTIDKNDFEDFPKE